MKKTKTTLLKLYAAILLTTFTLNVTAQVAESFEGTFLPTGWKSFVLSGTNGVPNAAYQQTAPGTYPTVASSFNGTKMML